MTPLQEELTWILGDFKKGNKNYAEAVADIEQLIARLVGLPTWQTVFEMQAEIDKLENN